MGNSAFGRWYKSFSNFGTLKTIFFTDSEIQSWKQHIAKVPTLIYLQRCSWRTAWKTQASRMMKWMPIEAIQVETVRRRGRRRRRQRRPWWITAGWKAETGSLTWIDLVPIGLHLRHKTWTMKERANRRSHQDKDIDQGHWNRPGSGRFLSLFVWTLFLLLFCFFTPCSSLATFLHSTLPPPPHPTPPLSALIIWIGFQRDYVNPLDVTRPKTNNPAKRKPKQKTESNPELSPALRNLNNFLP